MNKIKNSGMHSPLGAAQPTQQDSVHGTVLGALRGFYLIGTAATAIGIGVVMLLNMATPIEFILDQFESRGQGVIPHLVKLNVRRLLGFIFLVLVSCPPFLVMMRMVLKPISTYLKQSARDQEFSEQLFEKARQRLINLPFMIIPANLGLWIVLPAILFFSAYITDRMEAVSAVTLAVRSTMVGFVSAAIVSFWIEAYARERVVPFFFPNGRLTEVHGAGRISISRRIRLFYRLGSFIPMTILLVTLLTVQWQIDSHVMSAREYGRGIIVFCLALFAVVFVGARVLNRFISRSIAGPVNSILSAVTQVREGNYNTGVQVVSNDEIGILGDATNDMIQGLAERELLRDTFGKYVAPEVRDEILSGHIPLDGELKTVTILFADLRDFTPMTESNDPKRVVKILNQYFEEMAGAIQEQDGLILQFLGDEIYAVFGAPVFRSDHPARAFMAGLAMRRKLVELNRVFAGRGWPTLHHGIGIHTGEVVAANIGTPDRLSYLLVGDTVNLASRLQSLTKEMGTEIILSAATRSHLSESVFHAVKLKQLPGLSIKGKKDPVVIYTLDES